MDAGYLIVRPFDDLYARFRRPANRAIYAIPQEGVPPSQMPKQYRGIDREALEAWRQEDLDFGFPNVPTPDLLDHDACLLMQELDECGASEDNFIFSARDAQMVWSRLKDQSRWELIWARRADANVETPADGERLGFEPTWFSGDHFSAICDSVCFPKWHGTDAEGTLFLPYFRRLNRHALFDNATDAAAFLDFYRSQSWTETGDFAIAEVWSVIAKAGATG